MRAVPTANLNRTRYMLLVFTDPRTPEQRAAESAEAQEEVDRRALGHPDAEAPVEDAPPVEAPAPEAAPAEPAGAEEPRE